MDNNAFMPSSLVNRIVFPAEIQNVGKVETFIQESLPDIQSREEEFGRILIALTEAVNNAIQHGSKCDPHKEVEIEYAIDGDIHTFSVKDSGSGFDPEDLPDPTDPYFIDQPNGRGVFLMRRLADDVAFKDGGRCVDLHFRSESLR